MSDTTTTLDALVGPHVLTGWDRVTIPAAEDYDADADVLNLELDGKLYSFVEDPNDGWRSRLEEVLVSEGARPATTFEAVPVLAVQRHDTSNDLLEFYNARTGALVAIVGTENTDDYYPCFVAVTEPEGVGVQL